MKNLILGALVVLAAACGGGGKPQLLDAAVDSQFACNPVAQTGCKAGEKCTWIVDIDATMTANEIGHIGCAPIGATSTPDGMACADAVAATNGGIDTCVAGDLCISRKCKPICDTQTASGVAGACTTNFACTAYAGVFDSTGSAVAGVCEPTCDPLTQRLKVGTTGIEACGSADPKTPSATCAFGPDASTFVCAPTGPFLYAKTDRVAAFTDPQSGKAYPNGCAPGFLPIFRSDVSGSMAVLCAGTCAPLKVDSEIIKTSAKANQGDPTVLAKLPTEAAPAAGNAVCVAKKKGADDVAPGIGEDCRFSWPFFETGNPPMPVNSPYNNTLGFCFAWEKYFNVMVPNNPMLQQDRSCAQLPPVAPAAGTPDAPWGSAEENGCYPLPPGVTARRPQVRGALATMRVGYASVTLLRHVLD